MNEQTRPRDRRAGQIGPWRLLDIVHATMPFRASLFGGAASLPQFGPPDAVYDPVEPEQELPQSNIDETERRQAVERERARRLMARRPGRR
jgi:hypothetical protein